MTIRTEKKVKYKSAKQMNASYVFVLLVERRGISLVYTRPNKPYYTNTYNDHYRKKYGHTAAFTHAKCSSVQIKANPKLMMHAWKTIAENFSKEELRANYTINGLC